MLVVWDSGVYDIDGGFDGFAVHNKSKKRRKKRKKAVKIGEKENNMAYVIAVGTAPQAHILRLAKTNLIQALNTVLEINRQVDEMTDAQVESQFGIPLLTVPAFRTSMDALVTDMQGTAVTSIISQVGFDRG